MRISARLVLLHSRRAVGVAALCGISVTVLLYALDARFPLDIERLDAPASPLIEDAEGTTLARRIAGDEQWCEPIAFDAMGHWLPLATVAIEDERFRSHLGVDVRAVLRATAVNLGAGRIREGASTISMQLIGMSFRTPRTLSGKAVEAFRALQLERALSKDEILRCYLNRAPYGGNVVGVSMAARAWFGKAPADLSLGEAALLAGLPQMPERLRPDRAPERARARRAAVLESMLELGVIDADQARSASRSPLPTTLQSGASLRADEAQHGANWALSRRPGGGRTTIRLPVQRTVQSVVDRHTPRLPRGADVAVVVIDVEAAAVIAHVGSADFGDPIDGQVDGARARRSPGSALKPFIYAAAIESGRLAPDGVLEDRALDLDGWRPSNFDAGTSGEVTVGEALRRSLNLPAFRVAQLAGLERCVGLIEASGVELPEGVIARSGLALVTGGTEVSLIDLTTGYATFARGGRYVPTRLFVDESSEEPTRAMSESTAEAIFEILSDEARAPHVRGGPSHVGGLGFMWKTGTSSGFADAWAVGHDRTLAVGVWVGRFDGAGDPAFVGSETAEPILAELFARLR